MARLPQLVAVFLLRGPAEVAGTELLADFAHAFGLFGNAFFCVTLGLGFSIAGALVCLSTYAAIIAPGNTTGESATSTAAKAMNSGHASRSAAEA